MAGSPSPHAPGRGGSYDYLVTFSVETQLFCFPVFSGPHSFDREHPLLARKMQLNFGYFRHWVGGALMDCGDRAGKEKAAGSRELRGLVGHVEERQGDNVGPPET